MRSFYINLDRRPERRAFMERQFERLGMQCERVAGIDGRGLPSEERRRHLRAFRWWCANGYRARNGEIGAALSHQSVYRRLASGEFPCACILEDDIELSDRFPEMLDAAQGFLNADTAPKILLIAPYGGRAESGAADAPFSFSPVRDASAASAYVLNAEAAGRLLEVNAPLHTTIDNWGRLARLGGIGLYDANPLVCSQDRYGENTRGAGFDSDTIDPGTVFVADMAPARRALHKAVRCLGVAIDRIIR